MVFKVLYMINGNEIFVFLNMYGMGWFKFYNLVGLLFVKLCIYVRKN